MTDTLHPAASHHYLPPFITAPGETDVLLVGMAIFLVVAAVGFGVLFFRLHTLPERIAHKSKKLQFEIVAVLGLISLFTHMHIFWIIGLVLALVDIPDFGGWLARIAGSVERIAAKSVGKSGDGTTIVEMGESHAGPNPVHGDNAALWPGEVVAPVEPHNNPDAKRS